MYSLVPWDHLCYYLDHVYAKSYNGGHDLKL